MVVCLRLGGAVTGDGLCAKRGVPFDWLLSVMNLFVSESEVG